MGSGSYRAAFILGVPRTRILSNLQIMMLYRVSVTRTMCHYYSRRERCRLDDGVATRRYLQFCFGGDPCSWLQAEQPPRPFSGSKGLLHLSSASQNKSLKSSRDDSLSNSAVPARYASEVDHDSPDVGHMSQTSAVYMEARRLVHRAAKAGKSCHLDTAQRSSTG